MAESPKLTGINHLTLTVTDVERSIAWYTTHLGFEVLFRFDPHRALMTNGAVVLALGPSYYLDRAIPGDVFSEFRVGIDHISFSVESLAALEEAAAYFDEQGIVRGEIKDLGETFDMYVMAFRDPDNIQLELEAPR